MNTIIIANDEAFSFLERYKELYRPYLENGKISICHWNENGTDFRTAVPELRSLVQRAPQGQWRAIIACPRDPTPERPCMPVCADNPFDYCCNTQDNPSVQESAVPLIRLSQMLGGIPPPGISYRFEHKEEKMPDGTLRSRMQVAQTNIDKRDYAEECAAWEELDERYSFVCDKPQQLFLVTTRGPHSGLHKERTDEERMALRESDSSRFWLRNRWPAHARFLFMDCARRGHAHFHEQMFTYWMSVLTLALNHIDSDLVQAYQVYRLETAMDREELRKVFSLYRARMHSIRKEAIGQVAELKAHSMETREQDSLPTYQRAIPVVFNLPQDSKMKISAKKLGLATDCPIGEQAWWTAASAQSKHVFTKLMQVPERALDQACEVTRDNAVMEHEMFYRLDQYQLRELDQLLNEAEANLLQMNTMGALPIPLFRKRMDETDRAVSTTISMRMTRKTTLGIGIFALTAFFMGFLPDIVRSAGEESFWGVVGVSALSTVLIAMIAVAALFWFRHGLKCKVGDYNGVVDWIMHRTQCAAEFYSNYLSKVCEYMRGRSIQQQLARNSSRFLEGVALMERHQRRLSQQMEIIDHWLSDFDMEPLMDEISFSHTYFNFDISPEENTGYRLRVDVTQSIPCTGGIQLYAPYPFIKEIQIKREALYE